MPRDLLAPQETTPPRDLLAEPLPVQPQEEGAPDSLAQNAFNVISELAAASNRGVTEFVDFLGPDTVNAMLNLSGSDVRVPTLTGALEPTGIQGGFMEPGLPREAVRAVGTAIPAAAGFKQVQGRDLTRAGDALAELLGAGSAAAVAPVRSATTAVGDIVQDVLPEGAARKAAELPLLRQSGEVAAAGFKLDDAGRVLKDKVQQTALNAGIDEGAVAMIAAANKATKSRMKEMMEVLEGGRKSLEFRNFNPPQRVVGQAINDRLSVIQKANKAAGRDIDRAANTLKNQPVDVSPAVNQFLDDLTDEGIGVNLKTGTLDFSDSTIEGLKEPQHIIRTVFKRLYDTKSPSKDAFKVHLAKKFIDEQVSYGKSQAGLSGRMEGIVKGLRHNLDGILDNQFPTYDRVNTIYKETRDVIDEIQSLAGRKVDLTGNKVDKALGTMSRKLLSNYNTGTAMETLFESMDDVATRYRGSADVQIDDDLKKLISLEAEIRRMFPSAIKPNTFQGEIGAEVARGAVEAARGDTIPMVGSALKMGRRLFSKDDEQKIKAIKELLSE